MSGHRINRISEDIMREICAILRTVKDPRVSEMLSVIRVDVTNDLSYATVHISAVEGMEAARESVLGLKSASGYIRRELGKRLEIRKIPELRFVAADALIKSAEISKMLKDIIKNDNEDNDETEN